MSGRLILASSSPRRRELLQGMGLVFEVMEAQVDESLDGAPEAVVRRLAQLKARDVAKRFPKDDILGADTLVSVDGKSLGKPRDLADAAKMLGMLSGRWHEVCTGVCLIAHGQESVGFEETRVRFVKLTDEDIQRYCISGEPMGKAGAYAIQGRAGMYIPEIQGSYSNVVGLPIALVREMLMAIGYLL
ncbi:MAG: Maf family protein [Eubacteriales bacterium]|nr:Maf family protein [Eubacteriales bacterium]